MAISAVSAANALENLDAEIPDWDFEAVHRQTREKWEQELARIEIDAPADVRRVSTPPCIMPSWRRISIQDVNGEYRGLDQNIHRADEFTNYAIFSLWDTYRATHPLFALIQARRDADMINSMLAHYDQSVDHLLPVWSLQGNETWCMIGYHAVPVIVDAFLERRQGLRSRARL